MGKLYLTDWIRGYCVVCSSILRLNWVQESVWWQDASGLPQNWDVYAWCGNNPAWELDGQRDCCLGQRVFGEVWSCWSASSNGPELEQVRTWLPGYQWELVSPFFIFLPQQLWIEEIPPCGRMIALYCKWYCIISVDVYDRVFVIWDKEADVKPHVAFRD